MPIFQDDDVGPSQDREHASEPTKTPRRATTPVESPSMHRKLSEESIRTELCEGPIPDSLENISSYSSEGMNSSTASPRQTTSDRLHYIEKLKRGENPAWLPNKNVSGPVEYKGWNVQLTA